MCLLPIWPGGHGPRRRRSRPVKSILPTGVLSIVCYTLGGVEAVIWTDTMQAVVLLGSALVCLVVMIQGTDYGLANVAAAYKLRIVNIHLDPTSASLALWVVVRGGLAQNFSSYISDQAVLQRSMTARDERRAATAVLTDFLQR